MLFYASIYQHPDVSCQMRFIAEALSWDWNTVSESWPAGLWGKKGTGIYLSKRESIDSLVWGNCVRLRRCLLYLVCWDLSATETSNNRATYCIWLIFHPAYLMPLIRLFVVVVCCTCTSFEPLRPSMTNSCFTNKHHSIKT